MRLAAIFVATQVALMLVGHASFLPAFTPLGEVPYNVKWWLALGTLMAREGPLVVWTPYPPVFPLAHLELYQAMGFDADMLWRHFFLRDADVAELASAAIRRAQWLWSGMNAVLLGVIGALIASLAAATRGRAQALLAGAAYLLMSQSYASRILTGIVSDQFDYLPCVFLLAALLALVREAPGPSAVAAAVGTATKLFPVVLAPIAWLRLRSWRARAWYAGAFGVASAALWLPLACAGQRPVLSFLRFTGARGAWESVWLYPSMRLPPWPPSSEMRGLFDVPYPPPGVAEHVGSALRPAMGPLLGLATIAALLVLFALARRRLQAPMETVRCALLALLVTLFFAKGFSSYFVQWFFPLLFVVYRAEVAASWVAAFLVVGNLEFVGDPATWPMYWPSLFLRHGLLFGLAGHQWLCLRAATGSASDPAVRTTVAAAG